MAIELTMTPKKELGEKYPAVVYKVGDVEDGQWGPQFPVKLVETSGAKLTLWLAAEPTERNRAGRCITAMNGTYPSGTYDVEQWIGLPVYMVYAKSKKPGAGPDEISLDLIKPREAAKGEKTQDLVNAAAAQDDLEAPF